ncbi:MAG: ABC transporter ATP-binding protein/permease [Treponema sp.]|jgi:ABC-type multidrug transport system fused ATPase/permease subunit|nr:ABC transporter ATP-binding protein/permease [Treponema sp.]
MMVLTFLNTAVLCVVPFVKIYATSEFINVSISIVTTGASMAYVIMPAVLLVITIGYGYLERSLLGIVWLKIGAALRETFGLMQMKKTAMLEYKHIENPQTLDLIRRTSDDGQRIVEVCQVFYHAVIILSQILSVFVIVMTVSALTGLVLLVISVPLLYIAMKAGEIRYDAEREITKYKRQYEYINEVASGRDTADERTLFEYGPAIKKRWHVSYEEFRKRDIRAIFNKNLHLEGGSIITAMLTIIIAAFLLVLYYQGKMDIGLYLSIMVNVITLIETMSWSFSGTISEMTNNHQYLKDVDAYFKLSEEEGVLDEADSREQIQTVEFKNVRFKYPGSDYYVLNGFSMKMGRGKHYACVGANGAGKTTVVKLLTGLYRDYEGSILINGKELREYPPCELRSMFAIVYQDYSRYQVSLRDNIKFGNMRCGESEIMDAINKIDLGHVVEKFEHGLDTPLGKILEGGQDISGGEWQKIALARLLVNKNAVQILDEPTAALDPIMENKVYENFSKISRDRTTLFISHRLGSTMLADIIFVIDRGLVAECGSHAELMKNGTIYKEMYTSQKGWYE